MLMREDCNKATLEICRDLALYARSDTHASETNLRLGFDVPERAMCDAHERERERLRRSRLRESEELTKCRSKLDRALRAAREAAAKHALEQSQIEAARDAAVAALEAREKVIEEREVVVRESVPPAVHLQSVETQCYGTEAYFGDPHAEAVAAALAAHAARRAELCRDKAVQTEAPSPPPPPPRRKRTTFMVRRLTPVEVAAAEAAAAKGEEDAQPEEPEEPEDEDVIEEADEQEPEKPVRVVTPPAPRRRRKNKYNKFKKKAKPAGLSLDALLETIYDVLEKKTMSDEVTRKDGVEPASLEQFVRTYFRGKLGLKKLAREKATGLFRRAAQLVGKSGRVRLFAIAVGLVSLSSLMMMLQGCKRSSSSDYVGGRSGRVSTI